MAVAFAATVSPSLLAQCATGQPFTTGMVLPVSGPHYGIDGYEYNTRQESVSVECTGLAPVTVTLRISEPHYAHGTVLFIAGGNGQGFYSINVAARPLQDRLVERGYRVIDTAWEGGWFRYENEIGIKRQSCRIATLMEWLVGNGYAGDKFYAVGNSGGAGAISYALTTWSASDYLDRVVLGGGPPMSRLDFTCLSPSSPAWLSLCSLLIPPNTFTCGSPVCSDPSTIVCNLCTGASQSVLRADSVMHTGATFDFPNTDMHVLLGSLDCTVGVPTALFFYNAISSARTLRFVAGAPHFVAQTEAGRDAIFEALVGPDLGVLPIEATSMETRLRRSLADPEPSAWGPGEVYPMFLGADRREDGFGDAPVGWVLMRLPEVLTGRGELMRRMRGGSVRLSQAPQ